MFASLFNPHGTAIFVEGRASRQQPATLSARILLGNVLYPHQNLQLSAHYFGSIPSFTTTH